MSFEKRIASEDASLINAALVDISRIFNKLGKNEATELEVLRTAKTLNIAIPSLKEVCLVGENGLLRPKNWS